MLILATSTHTDLDVLQEKRIDHYLNVDSNRNLSHSWKGFTKFGLLKEKPSKDTSGPGRDWQRFKQLPDQIMYGQKFGKPFRFGRNRNGQERPKLDNARKMEGIYCIDLDDEEYKELLKNARRKLERLMAPTFVQTSLVT